MRVSKIQLIIITGILWIGVSVLLMKRAIGWYPEFSQNQAIFAIPASILVALVKIRFIFINVTKENIRRIMNLYGAKVSAFAFHDLKFYILIIIMIGGGTLLRNIDVIPKYTLFPVYSGVAVAMFFAALMYFRYAAVSK